jgi:hypothetical protein
MVQPQTQSRPPKTGSGVIAKLSHWVLSYALQYEHKGIDEKIGFFVP